MKHGRKVMGMKASTLLLAMTFVTACSTAQEQDSTSPNREIPSNNTSASVPQSASETPHNPEPTADDECRAECEHYFQMGNLRPDVTFEDCVRRVCDGGGEMIEVLGGEGCWLSCRVLKERGELRDGVTVDECIRAMCVEDE